MSASEGERAMATFADQIGHPDSPRQQGAGPAYSLPGHPNRVAHQFRQETSVPLDPHFLTSEHKQQALVRLDPTPALCGDFLETSGDFRKQASAAHN